MRIAARLDRSSVRWRPLKRPWRQAASDRSVRCCVRCNDDGQASLWNRFLWSKENLPAIACKVERGWSSNAEYSSGSRASIGFEFKVNPRLENTENFELSILPLCSVALECGQALATVIVESGISAVRPRAHPSSQASRHSADEPLRLISRSSSVITLLVAEQSIGKVKCFLFVYLISAPAGREHQRSSPE